MRDVGCEAVVIANEIQAVLRGRDTAACYIALSMVLGYAASLGARPDFDGMMKLVENTARAEFQRRTDGAGDA